MSARLRHFPAKKIPAFKLISLVKTNNSSTTIGISFLRFLLGVFKDRAKIIRLNAHGWYIEKIAGHFKRTTQIVTDLLYLWQRDDLEELWDKPGKGSKTKYKEEDIVHLEECLRKEPRIYNSLQLVQKFECDRHAKLSLDRLRRVFKKKVHLAASKKKSQG